jgi:glycosyltransferase involved in cell wall biosynthesis
MHLRKSTNNLDRDLASADRPIRILQVVGSMVRAGIETWLMNVLRQIDRKQFQMDFLVNTYEPCAYDEEIRALGGRIIPCPLNRWQPWDYYSNFNRILQEYGPYDIIHSQVYFFSGVVLRLADQANIPTRIVHIHPLGDIKQGDFWRLVYRSLMTRWISQHANLLLTPSKASLESFQKICDCSSLRTKILYNGVELEKFNKQVNRDMVRHQYSLPIDRPIVIYVARFAPHKNHLQILRIAEKIEQQGTQLHWVMVGSHGELLTTLEEKAGHLSNVSLLKGVEDVSELLLASDLFFFPSKEEGFGVVAIEAAAAGLPIVATDLPTIKEACAPSHHAFMFPPENDEIATTQILKIIDNKELKEKLSADAKQWANSFSISNSVAELASLYKQC